MTEKLLTGTERKATTQKEHPCSLPTGTLARIVKIWLVASFKLILSSK